MSSLLFLVVIAAHCALFVVAADPAALLRGAEGGEGSGGYNINKNMEVLRRLLQWSPDASPNGNSGRTNYDGVYDTAAWTHWHTAWSMLSDDDLAAIAYDTSPLDGASHRAWGAAYVSRRGTGMTKDRIERRLRPERGRAEEDTAADDGEGTSFLRGNAAANENGARDLQSDPLSVMNIPEETTNIGAGDSAEETKEWEERLANAVKTTQLLNNKHGQLGGAAARQRLLTGTFAAWQWYDRSNLASPTNLDLRKVSRVHYAFFQTDDEGYLFGTDSWADANALLGPYEFAVSSEELPAGCKGGKGRPSREEATLDLEEGMGATTDGATNTTNTASRRMQTTCEYFEQCHRNFPNSKSCNIHQYEKGLIYRAHASGAQIYPSIGGWTLSSSFPTVAASDAGRKRFAQECVGLIEDYGFDGIDVDWEYPGYEPHGGSPSDRDNFNKLLVEVREAMNEYQLRTGDAPLGGGAFGLTAALPCGPANIDFLDVPFVSQVLDGMNLMTFDFHNEMEKVTGANSPLFDQEWDAETGLSVDGCVKNYIEGGAPANKMSIGVPFYGKTFAFATELGGCHSNTNCQEGGMVDRDNWPQDLGTPVYYNILDRLGQGGMVSKRHDPTKTQYAYFADGSGLVSYDDPQSVCDKVEYVNSNLLGGVFVWEMSGDLLSNLETPLLDAINRKMEETTFDCREIASPEDGAVVELPPKAPTGQAQVERGDDESVVAAIIDRLNTAEAGELGSGGSGKGAFTRAAFMSRTFDGGLFPSYVYQYEDFVDALETMATVGVDGSTFYLGHRQEEATQQRQLQMGESLNATEASQTSLVYGLVNIAAYLAQAMTDAIIHDACDELNTDYLPDDATDGIGLDDGMDVKRFPISNSCGQYGRSYQTEHCSAEESQYDCATQMSAEELASMETQGVSRGQWEGAPGPLYCGPKDDYGSTGFWDSVVGREMDDVAPTPNDNGRTDVEGCCWWGRGSLSIQGTCLYGKLNYHLGKNKADREGPENAMFPDVDFCRDPGQICAGLHSAPLRWISGMYAWMENVQAYEQDGFDYQEELVRYVNEDLANEDFFQKATSVHVLGCHDETTCAGRLVADFPDRLRAFEKVLAAMGLQFGSHAEPAPPFKAFPGQKEPAPAGVTVDGLGVLADSPTMAPAQATEMAVVPVNVFLAGVPDGKNMTSDDLRVFEDLMRDLLVPRLDTVDVDVIEVVTDAQIPNPEILPESGVSFDSQAVDGEKESVLQLVMNVTVGYNPPPPEGVRDWSLYLKTWIESFGNTMVEIFTSPKHVQHPQTSSKFWDDLTDISASNIHPPNTEPTAAPSPFPTLIIYPNNSNTTAIYAGVGTAVGLLILCFCAAFFYKLRQYRQTQAAPLNGEKQIRFEDEEASAHPQDRAVVVGAAPLEKVTEEASLGSEGSDSSEDDSSSSSDDSSSDDSSISSSSSEDESEYTNGEAAVGDEDDSTYDDTARSKDASTTVGEDDEASEDAPALHARSVGEPNHQSVDKVAQLMQRVSDNDPSLTSLVLSGMSIGTRADAMSLFDALAGNEFVRRVDLSSNDIDDDCASSLSLVLLENKAITHLNLANNSLYSEGAEYLIGSLDTNKTLVEVDLSGNNVDHSLLQEIEAILSKRRESAASGTNPAGSQAIASALRRLRENNLIELRLDGVDLANSSETDALFDALATNTSVTNVSLDKTGIDDTLVAALSLSLAENETINVLSLRDNQIEDGAEYLLSVLDHNTTITHVDLSGNFVESHLLDEIRDVLSSR